VLDRYFDSAALTKSARTTIFNFLSSFEESLTVTIRPPKHNSQGFTLVEMLATIMVAGIIMAFATPSFLSLNKPLRDGSLQFKGQLGLIRSKAISSNAAYRIRPKYPTRAEYRGQVYQETPHNFVVEYAANCQVDRDGYGLAKTAASATSERPYNSSFPNGAPDGWMAASQFDLDLPDSIGISVTPAPRIDGTGITATTKVIKPANQPTAVGSNVTYETHLNWEICYDNRGIAHKSVLLFLQDFQGNNTATIAAIDVTRVGGVDITTRGRDNIELPRINADAAIPGSGNPSF
jgi:prepilin-type N-terminal cleavage/methylation domain-containing protein